MSDPADIVAAAIRSAFVSYPKEDDPDWRSPNWIKPEECAHLIKMIMQHLKASGNSIPRQADVAGPTRLVGFVPNDDVG